MALILLPVPAVASRVVSITVELDGKRVLSGSTGDDGVPGPPVVWRYLKARPLHPIGNFVLQPEPGRSLEVVLRGKLQVRVQYGADIDTAELRLTRDSEQSDSWLIDPAWVEANAPSGDLNAESRRVEERRQERSQDLALSLAAVVFAALGLLVGLFTLGYSLAVGRRSWTRRAAITALLLCGLGLGWGFISEERKASGFEILRYSAGGGITLAALALVVSRRTGAADPVAAPGRRGP